MTKLLDTKSVVIPCERKNDMKSLVETYAKELEAAAPMIGSHGLDAENFEACGLFKAAVERIRGRQSASMGAKKVFLTEVLDYMKRHGAISDWSFTGAGDRHDYQVILNDERVSIFEAKGCLDGNNTTFYQRPHDADEFVLWSLCQNAGSDPRHNAWSGIHTRLGAKIMVENEQVDGLVIWDMLCGTAARKCPKIESDMSRVIELDSGRKVPPPCIYLFPRTVPNPRNNPNPKTRTLKEVGLLNALHKTFGGKEEEITSVSIEARMNNENRQRRTNLIKEGMIIGRSKWTTLKRADR